MEVEDYTPNTLLFLREEKNGFYREYSICLCTKLNGKSIFKDICRDFFYIELVVNDRLRVSVKGIRFRHISDIDRISRANRGVTCAKKLIEMGLKTINIVSCLMNQCRTARDYKR